MDVAPWALTAASVAAALVTWTLGRRARRLADHLGHELTVSEETLGAHEAADALIRQSQDRILSSMQDGILLFDGLGKAAFSNPALEGILGTPPPARSALAPIALRDVAERAASGELGASALVEIGGPGRWIRATATPAGEDGATLLVVRDVTETVRLDSVRRDFVANASHELKTPAATIQAAAETIRRTAREDPDAVPAFAERLEREAMRLSRIVADLLDLSRLESGSELDERVRFDALVREELERYATEAEEAGLRLWTEAPEAASVRGSARDLSLLVGNLLDNAIRHTRRGGSVRVRISVVNGQVTLEVSDDGIGIPTKDLPRIFERFYRVDQARSRETGGTGLGLAIVKHVAENHGGSVVASSELGRGSTFVVRLPAI